MGQMATSFNRVPDDVSITGLTFGWKFIAAIEGKQVAAQEERTNFSVEKAEQDTLTVIITSDFYTLQLNFVTRGGKHGKIAKRTLMRKKEGFTIDGSDRVDSGPTRESFCLIQLGPKPGGSLGEMPSTYTHLFKFFMEGLQPQKPMLYLDLITRCT